MEKTEKMKWISVEDRLPELTHGSNFEKWSEYVLLYMGKDEDGIDCYDMAVNVELSNGDRMWDIDGGLRDDVTHWMPLPKPPEGGER